MHYDSIIVPMLIQINNLHYTTHNAILYIKVDKDFWLGSDIESVGFSIGRAFQLSQVKMSPIL